jgi:hypothetical protein
MSDQTPFSPLRQPAIDPVLLDLKSVAMAGGKLGPLFDQGVLSVIDRIERTDTFTPDPIKCVHGIHHALARGANFITAAERANAEEMVRQRGWTLEQGAQYARGVAHAESTLSLYDATKLNE